MSYLIRALQSNLGLAETLAKYQQLWGNWRELFKELDRINSIKSEDIMKVANKYLVPNNMTVATIETIKDVIEEEVKAQ